MVNSVFYVYLPFDKEKGQSEAGEVDKQSPLRDKKRDSGFVVPTPSRYCQGLISEDMRKRLRASSLVSRLLDSVLASAITRS